MKLRTLSLFVTAAAALSAQKQTAGFRGMQYEVMDRKVINPLVKSAPYSAQEVTESTQTLADGNRIKNSVTSQVYRDVEGRVRMERNIVNAGNAGAATKAVTIIDPVAGAQYQLDMKSKTASKTTFQARTPGAGSQAMRAKRMMPPPADGVSASGAAPMGGGPQRFARGSKTNENRVTESLGHQAFDGVDAEGTRVTTTIPAGTLGNEAPIQIVNERWYSPDLQVVTMSRHSDPRAGETVYKLTNISRANPDSSLFALPTDFQLTEGGPKGFPGHRP